MVDEFVGPRNQQLTMCRVRNPHIVLAFGAISIAYMSTSLLLLHKVVTIYHHLQVYRALTAAVWHILSAAEAVSD